jgi:hypothetical protein
MGRRGGRSISPPASGSSPAAKSFLRHTPCSFAASRRPLPGCLVLCSIPPAQCIPLTTMDSACAAGPWAMRCTCCLRAATGCTPTTRCSYLTSWRPRLAPSRIWPCSMPAVATSFPFPRESGGAGPGVFVLVREQRYYKYAA